MPMANGGTGVGSNDALTNNLAGMSKHQLYEVMVQMKVHSTFILPHHINKPAVSVAVWTLTCTRLIYTVLHHDQSCSELVVQMLVQQNQQQARRILIANPQLTKSLFQVLSSRPCVLLADQIYFSTCVLAVI
jgi:transcription initiation factor TFIID subunit TAF12